VKFSGIDSLPAFIKQIAISSNMPSACCFSLMQYAAPNVRKKIIPKRIRMKFGERGTSLLSLEELYKHLLA
jgi:hypothetical protein